MDNFDLRKYLAESRLLKENKPAGYYNAATISSHSDYYDIIITNKEEFFKIQKDPDSFMGEEAEEYLVDLEPGIYQMIYWNDEGPDSMGFDSKLDYVKESISNFWGEDYFEEKFGIEDILDAAGDNWESAFHKHIEDNLDKYYEELNSLIKNSYPDKDSASGVVLLVNGKEVAGADNGRLTNMLGTADEIKRDMLRENIDPFNVDVFGYKTKYYKVCPGAKAFMDKVMAGDYGDMSQRQNEVIRIAKLHDLLFIRELKALKDPQYAAEIIPTAEYIAEEIKDNVQFLGIPVADVDYVDNHIEIIKDAAKKIAENKLNENKLNENKMDNFNLKKYLAEGRLLKEQLMPKKISDKPFTIIYPIDDMSDYEAYDELLSDREQDLATGDMGDKFAFDSNTSADEIEDYLMPETPEEGNKKLERIGLSKYWKY